MGKRMQDPTPQSGVSIKLNRAKLLPKNQRRFDLYKSAYSVTLPKTGAAYRPGFREDIHIARFKIAHSTMARNT